MRLIDADALLAVLNAGKCSSNSWNAGVDHAINSVRNAPTLQPDGDAISRAAVLERIRTISSYMPPLGEKAVKRDALANEIKNLPALPVTAPDVVTAEDVVEGIEWRLDEFEYKCFWSTDRWMLASKHSTHQVAIDKQSVAAMLNVAESVMWPEGHPRNPTKPKPPTLLEAAEMVLAEVPYPEAFHEIVKELKAAIEREKGKEETK